MRFSFYSGLCAAGLLATQHFTPAQAIQMADDNQDAFVVNANEFQSLAEVDAETFADADIMMVNA